MKKYTQLLAPDIDKVLMLAVALLFSTSAISQHDIGRVIYTSGKLVAINGDETRTLLRGSNISEGDVISSGSTTRTQLRMIDGALISLRRNTEIRFDEYQYNKNRKSSGVSIFSLLKGGFNTISGLIGKYNKKKYRVKTSVATIGVRGTHYGVTLCSQGDCTNGSNEKIEDGLYASVIDGEIFSENIAGYFVFSNDEYFYIADAGSAPRSLIKAPGVIFGVDASSEQQVINAMNASASDQQERSLQTAAALYTTANQENTAQSDLNYKPTFTATDDINSNAYMVASKPGNAMMLSFWMGTPGSLIPQSQLLVDDGTTNNQFAMNAIAAADNIFKPIASRITFGAGSTIRELYIANATYSDVGAITIANTSIGWGRWTGDLYNSSDDGVDTENSGSLHYVIADALTTPAQYGAMTGTFAYTTVGGTYATDLNGNVATSMANVKMDVSFGGLQRIDLYTIDTVVNGNTYAAQLGVSGVAGTTPITTAINNGMNLTWTATCPSCGGLASLALVGSQAEGAITSYNIGDAITSNGVSGTAVLQR
jgi:hypothetical protein